MSTFGLSEIPLWMENNMLKNRLECDKSVIKLIQNKLSCQDNYNQIASDWLKWCKTQTSRVKVIDYDVPAGILPEGFSGCLYDIKVQGKRRCPDDTLYNKHADLR